ncbi:MAG: glycosyl transferase, partial [Gammaproteobacteria bacterium]
AAAGFAVLGWLDFPRSRAVAGRLVGQCAVAAGVVAVLAAHDALPAVPAAPLVVVLACVWSVNLFHFMDGADGLAGLQLAFTASGALLVPGVAGAGAGAGVAAVLAGAALGFLAWNRPPARIFMGDTGSYFVGFELAALALLAPREGGLGVPWVVLFLPFVVDASLTLAGRVLQGQRFWNAHREHAYQRLLLAGWRAPRLLLALALVNLAVCWPLAWWAASGGGLPAAGAALLALGVLLWRARVAAARRRAG